MLGMPGMGAMGFGMPPMAMAGPATPPLQLKATDQTTNLLGYACKKYEMGSRGDSAEIWATDRLIPFSIWRQNPLASFGPSGLREQWPDLLRQKKLFPLLAVVRTRGGQQLMRFEVAAIVADKDPGPDGKTFLPPADFTEVRLPEF